MVSLLLPAASPSVCPREHHANPTIPKDDLLSCAVDVLQEKYGVQRVKVVEYSVSLWLG